MWRANLFLLLLGTASCSFENRLWRISPLAASGTEDADRFNGWPLAYHSGEATSVLWPLFDLDRRGFALRPIVTKDDSRWSVLYPWASIDSSTGQGWVAPYYHLGESWGFLPVFTAGPLRSVGPVWWRRNTDSRGVFPLLWTGRNHQDLGVLPFYWQHQDEDATQRYYLLGLGHTLSSSECQRSWVLPVWFHQEHLDQSDTVVAPLFWRHRQGDDAHVFTLLGDRRVGPDATAFNLYPFWWSSRDGPHSFSMLLPLFYSGKDAASRSLLTPLGGRGWSTDGSTRFVNVLGPLYHQSRNADNTESRHAFLWPLIEHHRDHGETTFRITPLLRLTTSAQESSTSFLLYLGRQHSGIDGNSFRLWPLVSWANTAEVPDLLFDFTLLGRRTWEGGSSFHLAGPLLYQHRAEKGPGGESESTRAFTFFTHDREVRSPSMPDSDAPDQRRLVRRTRSGLLFRWFVSSREDYLVWQKGLLSEQERQDLRWWSHDLDGTPAAEEHRDVQRAGEVLGAHEHDLESLDDRSVQEAVNSFARDHTGTLTRRHLRIPLLFEYEHEGDRREWDTLLWLVHSTEDEESARLSILYYGFRQETRDGRTARDIFPFITYDTGPDECRFSFLWRLFRYERREGHTGGNILFVPWGDL